MGAKFSGFGCSSCDGQSTADVICDCITALGELLCEKLENLEVTVGDIDIEELDVTASGLAEITLCDVDCNTFSVLFCKDENHAGGQGNDTDDGDIVIDIIGWVDHADPTGVNPPDTLPAGLGACTACPTPGVSSVCLCDDDDSDPTTPAIPFIRYFNEVDGTVLFDVDLDGEPYFVAGTVVKCADNSHQAEFKLCDDDDSDPVTPAVPFIRVVTYFGGVPTSFADYELDGITPYVPVGEVGCCVEGLDVEQICLCDDTLDDGTAVVEFIRHFAYNTDASIASVVDTTLDGAAEYVPVGTVGKCGDAEIETHKLCDDTLSDGTAVVPFIRTVLYRNGVAVSAADYEIDGITPYVPLGAIVCCPEGGAVNAEKLCDDTASDGTVVERFIRHYAYDAAGNVVVVNDTELDGVTAYVVVGDVICCPDGDVQTLKVCDDTLSDGTTVVPFLRVIGYSGTAPVDISDYELDGVTEYTVLGDVVCCPESGNIHAEKLCDLAADGAVIKEFVRFYSLDSVATVISTSDTELDGVTPYVPAGTVGCCPVTIEAINIEELDVTASGLATVERCDIDCNPVTLVVCKDENHADGQGVDSDDGDILTNVIGWVDAAGVYTVGLPTVELQACSNCPQKVEACVPELWCVEVWENFVDNHYNGERPPHPVAWPQDDHNIDYVCSDGSMFSVFAPATGQGQWGAWNDQHAALIDAVSGKGWVRGTAPFDGDPNTPYGAYASVECCPGDKTIVSATATVVGGKRDGRLVPLLTGTRVISSEKVTVCLCCDALPVWKDAAGEIIPEPECAFPCTACPCLPEKPTPVCEIDTLGPLCDIVLQEDEDGNPIDPTTDDIVQSGVYLEVVTCEGATSVTPFTIDNPDEPEPYDIVGYLGDCDTLAPVEEVTTCNPDCQFIPTEWQLHHAGVDNNGVPSIPMRFDASGTFEVTLADGTVATVDVPATTGWTQQIDAWAVAFGAVFPDCTFSTRCLNPNTGGGCGSTPGPSPDAYLGTMFYRYMAQECCEAGRLIVSVEIVASSDPTDVGGLFNVQQASSECIKGYKCVTCDGVVVYDANMVQIPADSVPVCCDNCVTVSEEKLCELVDLIDSVTFVCPDCGDGVGTVDSIEYVNSDITTDFSGGLGDVDGDGSQDDTKWNWSADEPDAEPLMAFTRDCLANGATVRWDWTNVPNTGVGPSGSQTFDASEFVEQSTATGGSFQIFNDATGDLSKVASITATCLSTEVVEHNCLRTHDACLNATATAILEKLCEPEPCDWEVLCDENGDQWLVCLDQEGQTILIEGTEPAGPIVCTTRVCGNYLNAYSNCSTVDSFTLNGATFPTPADWVTLTQPERLAWLVAEANTAPQTPPFTATPGGSICWTGTEAVSVSVLPNPNKCGFNIIRSISEVCSSDPAVEPVGDLLPCPDVEYDVESIVVCIDGQTGEQITVFENGVANEPFFYVNGEIVLDPTTVITGVCVTTPVTKDVCFTVECEASVMTGAFTTAPDVPEDLTGVTLSGDDLAGNEVIFFEDPVTTFTWRDYCEGGRLEQLIADTLTVPYEYSCEWVVDDGENSQLNIRLAVCDPDLQGVNLQFAGGDATVGGSTELITTEPASGILTIDSVTGEHFSVIDCFGELVAGYTLVECPDAALEKLCALLEEQQTTNSLLEELIACFKEPCDDGDGLGPPLGDQLACQSRKLGTDITSTSAGTVNHTVGSLYDGAGPVLWVGSFMVTDSAGNAFPLSDGGTATGLASGQTQQVAFTGEIEFVLDGETFRCPVTDKPISANVTVQ